MPELVSAIFRLLWLPLLFAVLWLGTSLCSPFMSGWPTLAELFPAGLSIQGQRFRFASGCIGSSRLVNYRSCLFITVAESGFLLSVFFTRPLFIPWAQVESVIEQRRSWYWFIPHAVVRLRGTSTKIMVRGPAGRSIMQAYVRNGSNPRSNPSVEGTHNGGARLLASEASAAPSCAPHVKR